MSHPFKTAVSRLQILYQGQNPDAPNRCKPSSLVALLYFPSPLYPLQSADLSGPLGIILSIAVSFVVGLAYILALLFSIQDPAYVVDVSNETGGYAGAQVFFGKALGFWALFGGLGVWMWDL